MPHPAKTSDPAPRAELKRSVNGAPNKAVTKKDGAGGRGTWGKEGEGYDEPNALDKGDPNYDPDESVANVVIEASE